MIYSFIPFVIVINCVKFLLNDLVLICIEISFIICSTLIVAHLSLQYGHVKIVCANCAHGDGIG